jgi:hypothetical protein
MKIINSSQETEAGKRYVFTYFHNGQPLYYGLDMEGADCLFTDKGDATIFKGEKTKVYRIEEAYEPGDEIYCEDLDENIVLEEKIVLTEVELT